jgi:hypothetical protein
LENSLVRINTEDEAGIYRWGYDVKVKRLMMCKVRRKDGAE